MLGEKLSSELLEILKERKGNLYDFIANNYWKIDKDDLKDLALEITHLLYTYVARENPHNIEKGELDMHHELLDEILENRPTLLNSEEDDDNMKIEDILNAIEELSHSQGFYGRLLNRLLEIRENYKDEWQQVVEELEKQHFKTKLDMVLYFEQ